MNRVSPSHKMFLVNGQISENSHILITNYEQLRNTNKIIETLNFDVLITDEAHKIRKLSSGVTKGVQRTNRSYFGVSQEHLLKTIHKI